MAEIFSDSKDYFSGHAKEYAAYRPAYPYELIRYISNMVKYRGVAWDCACGNGQLALGLAEQFHLVMASDISETQIASAPGHKGVLYTVQPSEKTDFPDGYFDLIVIGQALHWFDFDAFYKEVDRVLAPQGLIIAIGYGLIEVNPEIDKVVYRLYHDILGDYWPPERKYVENRYEDVPWPFKPLNTPAFDIKGLWDIKQFMGYLSTWSALKLFENKHQFNPLSEVADDLKAAWAGEEYRKVRFPLFVKGGKRIV
jgi:SAM-dependent methyltransferase